MPSCLDYGNIHILEEVGENPNAEMTCIFFGKLSELFEMLFLLKVPGAFTYVLPEMSGSVLVHFSAGSCSNKLRPANK